MKTVCARVARLCVRCRPPHAPLLPQHPPCHFQLRRDSGLCYGIAGLTRPHLLDTQRQSAINTPIHGETRPTVLLQDLQKGAVRDNYMHLRGGGRRFQMNLLLKKKKSIRLLLLQRTRWNKCRISELKNLKVQKRLQKAQWRTYSVSSSKTFRESLLSSGDSQPLPLGKEDKMKTFQVSHEKGLNKVLLLAYGTVRHQLKSCHFFPQ